MNIGSTNSPAARPQPAMNGPKIWPKVLVLLSLIILSWLLTGHNERAAAAPRLSAEEAIQIATQGEIGEDFLISQMGSVEKATADDAAVAYGKDNIMLVVWSGNYGWNYEVEKDHFILGRFVNSATGELLGDSSMRISSSTQAATQPDVTYNEAQDEFLIVWSGIDTTIGEQEIHGRLLSRSDGFIGAVFRLSFMGPDKDPAYGAFEPAVAYTTVDDLNHYLVVWSADDKSGALADNEREIYAAYLNASGGRLVDKVRISFMGPDGNAAYQAVTPDVVYNSATRQFLIVWRGEDDKTGKLSEWEIYGRHIHATDPDIIGEQTRLTDMGTTGATGFDAISPAVAFNPNPAEPEYLLVWSGDKEDTETVNSENEIFAQRLQVKTGMELDPITLKGDMFRVSRMGPEKDPGFDAFRPEVVYNSDQDEYYVTWIGKDKPQEWQIYGQRVHSDGASDGDLEGGNQQLSDLASDGVINFTAYSTGVAYDPGTGRYLVITGGPDDQPAALGSQSAIYAQLVNAQTGFEVGENDFLVSDPTFASDYYYSVNADAAFSPAHQEFFVVWEANTNEHGLHQDRFEIFGRRIDALTGQPLGEDIKISHAPSPETFEIGAGRPAVAYSDAADAYLVVWEGKYPLANTVQYEIWGTQVAAGTGEVSPGDKRISFMGPDSNARDYTAFRPDVAYSSATKTFLVVWDGEDDLPGLALGEDEIYGQLVNSLSGELLGENVRISTAGPDGDAEFFVADPKAVYNAAQNQFFVVWEGEDNRPGDDPEGNEIYGQIVNAGDLAPSGESVRISFTGPDGDADYDAGDPAAAFNAGDQEYLVVWQARVTPDVGAGDKDDIYGQRLNALDGALVGEKNFRISYTGLDSDNNLNGSHPDVAFDAQTASYLVVWQADAPANNDFEVYGRYLRADGTFLDETLQISDADASANTYFGAYDPAVVAGDQQNRFLAVFDSLQENEQVGPADEEVYGQFMGAAGVQPHQIFLPMTLR